MDSKPSVRHSQSAQKKRSHRHVKNPSKSNARNYSSSQAKLGANHIDMERLERIFINRPSPPAKAQKHKGKHQPGRKRCIDVRDISSDESSSDFDSDSSSFSSHCVVRHRDEDLLQKNLEKHNLYKAPIVTLQNGLKSKVDETRYLMQKQKEDTHSYFQELAKQFNQELNHLRRQYEREQVDLEKRFQNMMSEHQESVDKVLQEAIHNLQPINYSQVKVNADTNGLSSYSNSECPVDCTDFFVSSHDNHFSPNDFAGKSVKNKATLKKHTLSREDDRAEPFARLLKENKMQRAQLKLLEERLAILQSD